MRRHIADHARKLFFEVWPQQHRELAKALRELRIAGDLHVAPLQHRLGLRPRQRKQAQRTAAELRIGRRRRISRDSQRLAGGFHDDSREAANVHADAPARQAPGTARARAASAAGRDSADSRSNNDTRDARRRCRRSGCDSGSPRGRHPSSCRAAFPGPDACGSTPRGSGSSPRRRATSLPSNGSTRNE